MSIVREFERAFNRQDVDALVACFTPTGTYGDNFFGDHAGSAAWNAIGHSARQSPSTALEVALIVPIR